MTLEDRVVHSEQPVEHRVEDRGVETEQLIEQHGAENHKTKIEEAAGEARRDFKNCILNHNQKLFPANKSTRICNIK